MGKFLGKKMIGRKLSKEWRKNISQATNGRVSSFKGKKHSIAAKKKISIANTKKKLHKICEYCQKKFSVNPSLESQKFCSLKCCYKKRNETFIEKKCKWCKNIFYIKPAKRRQKFCCHKCWLQFYTGRNNPLFGKGLPKSTKQKLSFAQQGNKNWLGRKHKQESKDKISQTHQGQNNPMFGRSGPTSPTWKGGLSFEPYNSDFNHSFKCMIRGKYNFSCVECGIPRKKLKQQLHCHHIDYDKKNNTINNVIPLCNQCHMKTNFDRKKWTKFFKQKIHAYK